MPKMCYCRLKSIRRICKHALITPLLPYIFVKRNVHKQGHGCCTFSSTITMIIREVQVNLSTRLGYQTTNSSFFKHDKSQSHTSAIHHQNCFPHRQLYILLKLPIHSLHYCYSQLYCYMKAALLNKNLKQLQLAMQISSY